MNNNLDENTMNNIKKLVDNGNISEAISQISPEMIENFSKMMNSNTNKQNKNTNSFNSEKDSNTNTYNNSSTSNSSNFDFSKIDINTIMKMKSVIDKVNDNNDPRSNLLYSLKPYLRHEKQDKLDQYVNLLNFSKVAEVLKNDNSNNPKKN